MLKALHRVAHHLTGGHCKAEQLDWTALRYQHTSAVRAVLAEHFSPATANQALSALRGVLAETWMLGYMSAEEYHRAAKLPAVRGGSLPRGRALSAGELRALFEQCEVDVRAGKARGMRDAAMLAVLYGTGLRRSELVSLDLSDFHADAAELKVRRGKGRKARLCYTPPGCVRALTRWIERSRGREAGPLFGRINKAGVLDLERLTDQAVLFILSQRAKEAKVGKFSPHDMRRTFIGDLLDAGADLSTVQTMAGHANIQTTARYDRRGEVTRRKAALMLHVPYGGE
jgi:integrase/recombinase XerD